MTEYTQEQVAENRRKAVEHLRTTNLPQGRSDLYNQALGCYCALGHCGLAIGIDAKIVGEDYNAIEVALGMDLLDARDVWRLNDIKHRTLHEIGDYLAAKWGIA